MSFQAPLAKTLAGEILPRAVFAKHTPGKRAAAFKTRSCVIFDNEAEFTIDELAEMVFADRTALEQILLNLVENSIRHTPEGGGVTIETASPANRSINPPCRSSTIGTAGVSLSHVSSPSDLSIAPSA